MAEAAWGWYGLCFRAMNTRVEVQLYAPVDRARADNHQGLGAVQSLFRGAEACMTRFDRSSELSRLNQSAGRAQRVSPPLYEVVQTSVWAAAITGGLFDPTLLSALEAIGYDRSFEQIERRDLPCAADRTSGQKSIVTGSGQYQAINMHRARREITLPPGVEMDLGGIGKGWTVDRAADWLAGQGPFLVNAGGDLYAYGIPPGQPGWSIGIEDPWQPERDIAHVYIHQQALATSTTSRRRWSRRGQSMHHLIDPRTGRPAETDAVSVSAMAQRTALAEIYAKVALILGVKAGCAWLNRIPEVEGLLVRSDGQLITTNGFPDYLEVTNDDANTEQAYVVALD